MIKCDPRAKAKCPLKNRCCGDDVAYFLEGSECDKFNQKVLAPPPTNADHIRSMTDEELAAILDAFCETSECRTADGAVCPFYSACPHDENIGCNGTCGIWTDWLKQPYKEDA